MKKKNLFEEIKKGKSKKHMYRFGDRGGEYWEVERRRKKERVEETTNHRRRRAVEKGMVTLALSGRLAKRYRSGKAGRTSDGFICSGGKNQSAAMDYIEKPRDGACPRSTRRDEGTNHDARRCKKGARNRTMTAIGRKKSDRPFK